MAQLKDTTIDGKLDVKSGNIILDNARSLAGIHPESGEATNMLSMSTNGNTIVGHGVYANKNGNTHIYGDEINFYVSANGERAYRPYRQAGDTISVTYRGAGYVTNGKKDISFLVPVATPIIGSPTATPASLNGFILRQGDGYTHGSSATVYVSPDSYSAFVFWNIGIFITAKFTNTTNVTNNDAIGIYWDGKITLS